MKKIMLVAFMMIAGIFMANAQTVRKGDKIVNIGVGFGTYGKTTSFPPLSVSFDYGVKDRLFDNKSSITIGGYAGFLSNKTEFTFPTYSYGWKYNNFLIGARGALHYEFVSKLDTYVGLILGYNIVTASYYSSGTGTPINSATGSGSFYSTYLGARYYVAPRFAIFAEVGYGLSALELGVSFKL
ncbi:hypothetical protein [Porphyromonas cangingivalis]|uniref:Outer membrane protein beta-barrel domain-containing protein n=2 Tax=Porphyromonas cangingivalis TaxID=36874 RepID=A0A1T4JPI0_PORCN|nr:hypothetical protein [Porphyromonas cangingivalis]KGL50166.1 hypothetical protein HQ34_00545 [Porphyromonas cangingivalis]SJZ32132.1 hypothetical protein SAMN02745205_00248 [Porphyromonas cangingivalis]VEJ04579.1 Uncharacterised protein [Porphyromonas cangingivalis]